MVPNGWSSPQMLHRYDASARIARAWRTRDRTGYAPARRLTEVRICDER
jgi:hypothetical protein